MYGLTRSELEQARATLVKLAEQQGRTASASLFRAELTMTRLKSIHVVVGMIDLLLRDKPERKHETLPRAAGAPDGG